MLMAGSSRLYLHPIQQRVIIQSWATLANPLQCANEATIVANPYLHGIIFLLKVLLVFQGINVIVSGYRKLFCGCFSSQIILTNLFWFYKQSINSTLPLTLQGLQICILYTFRSPIFKKKVSKVFLVFSVPEVPLYLHSKIYHVSKSKPAKHSHETFRSTQTLSENMSLSTFPNSS